MKKEIQKEKLEELISSNWKRQKIADFFQVSTKTISERVKEYGLTFKKETKQKDGICPTCGKHFNQSKYYPYCSKTCANGVDIQIYVEPTTELGKKIVELRKQGMTYKQIMGELGCNKSTISYYCGKGQKEHKQDYVKNIYDPAIRSLSRRVTQFKNRNLRIRKNRLKFSDFKTSFRSRVSFFWQSWERFNKMESENKYGYKEVLDYIGGWETKCYLTGRPLDLRKDNYELDHIIPISKGGSCKLDNMGITCEAANQSKSNLTVEEYIQLCKEVLENFGYKVEKI